MLSARRCLAPCCLAILILTACATADKPSASGDSGKAPATHEATRHPAQAVRPGTGKTLPFADDEARRTVYFALGDTLIDADGVELGSKSPTVAPKVAVWWRPAARWWSRLFPNYTHPLHHVIQLPTQAAAGVDDNTVLARPRCHLPKC